MNKTILAMKKATGSPWLLISGVFLIFALAVDALITLTSSIEFFSFYTAGVFRLDELINLSNYTDIVNPVSMYGSYALLVANLILVIGIISQFICSMTSKKMIATWAMSLSKVGILIACGVYLLYACGLAGLAFGDIATFAVAGNMDAVVSSCLILLGVVAVIFIISTFYSSTRRSINSAKKTMYTGVVMGRVSETCIVLQFVLAIYQGVRIFSALTAPTNAAVTQNLKTFVLISGALWAIGFIFLAISFIVVRGKMRSIILQGVIDDRVRREKIEEIEAEEAQEAQVQQVAPATPAQQPAPPQQNTVQNEPTPPANN